MWYASCANWHAGRLAFKRRLAIWPRGVIAERTGGGTVTMIGLLVVLLAAPAPSVEVLTSQDQPVPVATPQGFVLAGQKLGGSLVSLDAGGVTLQGKKGRLQVAAADLLEVRFPTKPTTSTPQPASLVRLINGARLSCRGLAATPRQARLQTAHLGDLVVPSDQVAAIRFGPLDSKVRGAGTSCLDVRSSEIGS